MKYLLKQVVEKDSISISEMLSSPFLCPFGLMEHLPPFQFSLDAPAHLLPSQHKLNEHIKLDSYRQYIAATYRNPLGELCPRMAFYAEHYMIIQDGIIVHP